MSTDDENENKSHYVFELRSSKLKNQNQKGNNNEDSSLKEKNKKKEKDQKSQSKPLIKETKEEQFLNNEEKNQNEFASEIDLTLEKKEKEHEEEKEKEKKQEKEKEKKQEKEKEKKQEREKEKEREREKEEKKIKSKLSSESEESGETEEETEEEEEEEEEEPQFAYRRLGNELKTTLQDLYGSAFRMTNKILLVGTQDGVITVFDFTGTIVQQHELHEMIINQISLDTSKEIMATCSNDCSVIIYGLIDNEKRIFEFKSPVLHVSIDPYYNDNTRQFVVGLKDGSVFLTSKKLFGRKDTLLEKTETPVYGVSWRENTIIWINSKGITLYNTTIGEKSQTIKIRSSVPKDLFYKSSIYWLSNDQLLIAYSNILIHLRIENGRNLKKIKTYQFKYIISGIAEFKDRLIFLTMNDQAYKLVVEKKKISNKKSQKTISESNNNNEKKGDDDNNNNNNTNQEQKQKLKPKPKFVEITKWIKRKKPKKKQPDLRLFSKPPLKQTFMETVGIPRFEEYSCLDYSLDCTSSKIYIFSPNQIIQGRERVLDDRIKWFLSKGQLRKAFVIAVHSSKNSKKFKKEKLGRDLMKYYIEKNMYIEAAQDIKLICGNDPNLWKQTLEHFIKLKKLSLVKDKIPTENIDLPQDIYEKILFEVADLGNWMSFQELISDWPENIYDHEKIISYLQMKLSKLSDNKLNEDGIDLTMENDQQNIKEKNDNDDDDDNNDKDNDNDNENENENENKEKQENIQNQKKGEDEQTLLAQSLLRLFLIYQKHYESLKLMLEFKIGDPFGLIENNRLYQLVGEFSYLLLKFDCERAIEFFIQNHKSIPTEIIITNLQSEKNNPNNKETAKRFIYKYLDQLHTSHTGTSHEYHTLLMKYYAKNYEEEKLIYLLKISQTILPEKALEICNKYNFYPGMVELSQRIGDTPKALDIILSKIGDLKRAINFTQKENDSELWDQLIQFCLKDENSLSQLLDHLTVLEIDIIPIINKIPKGMKILGLKQKIMKILHESKLQIELNQVTKEIIKRDYSDLMLIFDDNRSHGLRVSKNRECIICGLNVDENNRDYYAFFCGHCFHQDCLEKSIGEETKSKKNSNYKIEKNDYEDDDDKDSSIEKTIIFGGRQNSPKKNIKKKKKKLLKKNKDFESDSIYCVICESRKKKHNGKK
ncbi:vacuolar protein sorting-associated protein 41 [Anaeramoeba flamelloides]|uniref:Vacuolar protein sorting-associated protein 41 n=1 Tax=Anaeramoeba flamelloides TaxID=1746091 RepID=A0AAV7ZW03_9EUKA|nr:vacuolar protein sorting-associated protein 41 [Anaeramoeba flamelloides]